MACGHLSTRDLQSCNACPCHIIIARRSNPQQTSTLFSWHCDDGRVHAATPLYPCPWADYFCQPPPPIPPPRVGIGQGNWKIVGSLRQFAIFCGLLASPLLPFHKHSGRKSSADHPSMAFAWPQDNTTSLSHPVVPMRASSKAAPGLWVFDPWMFGFGSEGLVGGFGQSPRAMPVLVHVLVPDE